MVNRCPGSVEVVTVKVEYPVGLDAAGSQAVVPSAVERCLTEGFGPFWGSFNRARRWSPPLRCGDWRRGRGFNRWSVSLVAR